MIHIGMMAAAESTRFEREVELLAVAGDGNSSECFSDMLSMRGIDDELESWRSWAMVVKRKKRVLDGPYISAHTFWDIGHARDWFSFSRRSS